MGKINPLKKYKLEKKVIEWHVKEDLKAKALSERIRKEYSVTIHYRSIDSFLRRNKKKIKEYVKKNPQAKHEVEQYHIDTAKELHTILKEAKTHLAILNVKLQRKEINYAEFMKFSQPVRQEVRKNIELALKAAMGLPEIFPVFMNNRMEVNVDNSKNLTFNFKKEVLKKIGDVLLEKELKKNSPPA